jgi:predicted neutral ceramidase superfamily lipid hydrolase
MPDENKDIFNYSTYFSRSAPGAVWQLLLILLAGVVGGIVSFALLHGNTPDIGLASILVLGSVSGIVIISAPALLTVLSIKLFRMRVKMRHIMLLTLLMTSFYTFFIMFGALAGALSHDVRFTGIIFILGNAVIFGYWLLTSKVFMGLQKSAVLAALLQPTFNILFYIAAGSNILSLNLPIQEIVLKTAGGMIVFFVMTYLLIFGVERPVKKTFNTSAIKAFTLMINQWLYDIGTSDLFTNPDDATFGIDKNVKVRVLVIKSGKKYKAVFVCPDIHYGPYKNIGGSVASEAIGSMIKNKYTAAPFVLHGAASAADNPVSASQVYEMSSRIRQFIDSLGPSSFYELKGRIGIGKSGACKAIDIQIGRADLLLLTKAPMVVEDIDSSIGRHFEEMLAGMGREAMVIDAHNSRFESASEDELKGVYAGSKYAKEYENAINNALSKKKRSSNISFGAAYQRIYYWLNSPKDMGKGYTSVGIFEFGREKFCMVCFDSNNILPSFREKLVRHIKKEFKMKAEIITTDTHSVNSLDLPVSNVLGRHTQYNTLEAVVDTLVKRAIGDINPVEAHSGFFTMENFRVWGSDADEKITALSRDLIRRVKYMVPFITIAGFIIAAVIIYLI